MKSKTLTAIVFLTGLAISGVAAYYSIVGLTTLFAGSFWSIVIMGSVLEVGKLVSISWLYNNWNHATKLVKAYLIFAILVLMLITSMGIFGFLSKAHIDQQLKMNTGVSNNLADLKFRASAAEAKIKDFDKQISALDDAVTKLNDKGQAKDSLAANAKNKASRDVLVQQKAEYEEKLAVINKERIGHESEFKKIEAEVGPIKYISELFYGESDEKVLEKAVRIVIMIIICVFDPLAILLLIAFNVSMEKHREEFHNMEFFDIKNNLPRHRGRRVRDIRKEDSPSSDNQKR
jgi:hypothetical protein